MTATELKKVLDNHIDAQMITFKISGNKHFIATCWGDVTYTQSVSLMTAKNLLEQIALFTGIDKDILAKAELKNLESISTALSFLNTPFPPLENAPTKMVGKYVLPKDVTVQSLGQFEDLRNLMNKLPKKPIDEYTIEDHKELSDAYLEACAIYVQKIKSGSYDSEKVPEVKEELKNYSCIEVIQTGAFFLFRPLNLLKPTTTRSQNIRQRLRKLIQDFPGYQKTSDLLQHSSRKAKE